MCSFPRAHISRDKETFAEVPCCSMNGVASSVDDAPHAAEGMRRRAGVGDSTEERDASSKTPDDDGATEPKSTTVLGRTPSGRMFRVLETPDMLSSIFRPDHPKTPLDLFTIASLLLQLVLFALLSREQAQIFFMVYFSVWRLTYNAGLGYILMHQSKSQWIVRFTEQRGWLDARRCPGISAWLRQQLQTKLGPPYKFEDMPLEYNVWILFRSLVDVILLNDFNAYALFGLSYMHGVGSNGVLVFVVRWVVGLLLIVFNIWVKVDAHRVVKDYAWYWGDCFFLCLQSLVFDGVYEVAPDPMYSIGYAGYYGLSLLTGSYTVLFVSLAAHTSQLLFLVFFENPHMDRVYGEKMPLAARVSQTAVPPAPHDRATTTSPAHDVYYRLFGSDNVVFSNVDVFRAPDFLLVVAAVYAVAPLVLLHAGPRTTLVLALANALVWRAIHSFGLGALLARQSTDKWMVRHFVKHYHYDAARGAVYEAFGHWKVIYNASLIMTYLSFVVLAVRCHVPGAGPVVLRWVLGVVLILLHIWSARSSYRVLGPFGWLYGDFFIDDYPRRLSYTGIYRFLNNPERTMGGAAFFGMALLSGSLLVAAVAVVSQLSHWWFLSNVEGPHMRRLYGHEVRRESGVTKQMKQFVRHHALLHAAHPTVCELQQLLERAQRNTQEAVDRMLSQGRQDVERLVDDTRGLLQAQADRLYGTHAAVDRTQYHVSTSAARYYLGEPIVVRWRVPPSFSRRDWIGLYAVDAVSRDVLVTRVSSTGRWVGVAENEWVGDEHTGRAQGPLGTAGVSSVDAVGHIDGMSVFGAARLPWALGRYELRYHCNGTHDVLARSEPIEVYVDMPRDPSSVDETYAVLSRIVRYALADSPADAPPSADADDLAFWSRAQVQRIADAIRSVFHVDLSPNVVVADANTAILARNVVDAWRLLQCTTGTA